MKNDLYPCLDVYITFMDTLVALFIKRALVSNINTLDPATPHAKEIKKGAALIWNFYYRYVFYEHETLAHAHYRLMNALDTHTIDTHYMNMYLAVFGPCWR
jgi:hypothetical protein